MKLIISPAKKMRNLGDEISGEDRRLSLPEYIRDAALLQERMQEMSFLDLKKLWACNEKIARLGVKRLEEFSLTRGNAPEEQGFCERVLAMSTPALLAYEGIQYQYMAPQVFTAAQWEYVCRHLRILSGFYGILRPMDGVVPYRLEMQAKLSCDGKKDLYEFWGSRLFDSLTKEDSVIVNLASKEYSKIIEKYLRKDTRYITCIFGEEQEGRIKVKGTLAKMARGEMVRFLSEHQIEDVERLREFNGLGFDYAPEYSREDTYVFLRKKEQ